MGIEKYLEDKIKKVTSTEVQEIFETEFDVSIEGYASNEIQYSNYENDNYKVESEIDSYGGDGQGEEYWVVSRILDKRTNESFFIKFDGYYSSWEGSDFSNNDWDVVAPKEVKVVQWH